MFITTFGQMRQHGFCDHARKKILAALGMTDSGCDDDYPLSLPVILDLIGLNDAVLCLQAVKGHKEDIRKFAIYGLRKVPEICQDALSLSALDIAEGYSRGDCSKKQLAKAQQYTKIRYNNEYFCSTNNYYLKALWCATTTEHTQIAWAAFKVYQNVGESRFRRMIIDGSW